MEKTGIQMPFYISPEMIANEPCGIKSDMYSVGILLYELLFEGKFPFIATNKNDLEKQICQGIQVLPHNR